MPAEQQGNIYVGGWKLVDDVYVYVGGWKRVNEAFTYHNGAWRRFYAYDATAPTVTSFTLDTLTANATYSAATQSVAYTIVFSEPVTGLAQGDFSFIGSSTTWSIGSPTNPSGDQKTYKITVTSSGVPNTGSVRIRLANNAVSDIVDGSARNLFVAGPADSPIINIDNTRPTVSSFSTTAGTYATSAAFTLNFAESVTGLTTSDISIGGTSTGWSLSSLTGSGSGYTVNMSGASATFGTLVLTLAMDSVSDAVANTGPAAATASTTFNVSRTPSTTSISSVTSSAPTLHNRTLTTTVSVPESRAPVDELYLYYYDSNDNYISGSAQTYTLPTATSGAFTRTFTRDMGRVPGTTFYVRAQTRSTQHGTYVYSDASARASVTTQADQTPPTASSLSMSDTGSYPDPGYPGRASASRQLTLTWSNANLTDEVNKITVYIAGNAADYYRPAGGWSQGTTSRTLTGLEWGTNYAAFIRSTDIYGGTNSTADTGTVTWTTAGPGFKAQENFSQTITNALTGSNTIVSGWASDSAYTDWGTRIGTPGYGNDSNINTVWVSNTSTSGRAGWTGWFSTGGTDSGVGGTHLDGIYITGVNIRTGRQHDSVYLGIYTAYSGTWIDNTSDGLGNDPYYGSSVIATMNSNGGGADSAYALPFEIKIKDSGNSGTGGTLNLAGHFRLRVTGEAKTYAGFHGVPSNESTARFGLIEVDFTAVIRKYTPAYYF